MASWEALKDLVATALELPVQERTAYLSDHCADEGMLQEAISLATHGDHANNESRLLDQRADTFIGLGGTNPSGLSGRQLGKYTLLELAGQGGMGAVYLARQRGVDRKVAVKVVPPHALMFDARSRFEREIQALGRIDHPGVARVFDSGLHVESTTPGLAPIPYFAMEWVDGLPLTKHVQEHNLSLRARIELMIDVADAVQAAHQRAVVHCDLKPANVLVQPPVTGQANGVVKVVDFGLARLMETGVGNVTATFSSSSVMGTLAYMAPEQACGDLEEIGFQTDVYALGVLLHEVVHGVAPMDLKGLSLTEALRRVEQPNPRMLKVASDFTGGDLACVISVAMAPEKQHRYSSVEAFADDLRRLLGSEPIVAQPQTTLYKVRKFAKRNRAGVLAGSAIIVALVVGFGMATFGLIRERTARRDADAATVRATQAQQRAESSRDFLKHIVTSADPGESGRDVTVVDAVRMALPAIEKYAVGDPVTESELRFTVAQTFRELGHQDDAEAEYAKAHALAVEAHGVNSFESIDIAIESAVNLANTGKFDEADRLIESLPARIVKLDDKRGGEKATAMLGEARANLLIERSEYEQAALTYEDILSRWSDAHDVIDTENLRKWRMNYALALSYAGQLRKAEVIQREIVASLVADRGADHLETLIAQQNLAGTLVDFGEFDEARKLFENVIEKGGVRWGKDHPNMLSTRRSMASLEFARANYNVAADLAEAVIEDGRKVYPADAPFILLAENVYTTSLLANKDWKRGLPAMRSLVEKLIRLYGDDSPETLAARSNLASGLSESGDKEGAVAELRAILPLQRAATGDTASGVLITQNNLGMMELELGNTEQALKLVQDSLDGAIEAEQQPFVPLLRKNVGRVLAAADRYEEAEKALLTSYEEAREILGENQQQRIAQTIVELYESWGRPEKIPQWAERAEVAN